MSDTNSPAIAPANLERVLTCPLVAFLAAVLLVVGYGLVTGNPRPDHGVTSERNRQTLQTRRRRPSA